MIVTADWVVPIADQPIREGAVLVRGSHIEDVGAAKDLIGSNPRQQVRAFEGCSIFPGLVNAHTHLALTCLKGVVPPQPFPEWIRQIPKAYRALTSDDIAASTTYGAVLSLAAGVTVVGDITHGPEGIAIAADTGLGGAFYWEVLGATRAELPQRLAEIEFPADPAVSCRGRLRCGLSPHSVYASGPDLIRTTYAITRAQGTGFAIHAAESDAEVELVHSGSGPLAGLAARLADGFETPGVGVVRYLAQLGVLDDAVLVHGAKIIPAEIPVVARRARGLVLCPRSNAYLGNGEPAARRLHRAGMRLALGTDSLASNSDLDLLEEARALHAIEPSFAPEELLRMMTLSGAHVLGLQDEFGSLEPGKQADLIVHRLPGADPVGELISQGGRGTLQAVMSGGVFRVLDGGAVFAISPIERASHIARQKASLAVLDATPGWI